MFRVNPVHDINDSRLAPYRTMREQEDHHHQRVFIAEGEKVVRRLLETDFAVISLLLPKKWLSEFENALSARREQIDVFVADKGIIESLIGFPVHQGVLALARIPAAVSIQTVVESTSSSRLFIAMDGLSGVENVGVLVRNAAAFGAQAIIVGENSSHPYLRRAVRLSMGTIFKLPYVESFNLVQTLNELQQRGVACIAAHPHTDARYLWQTDLRRDCCIVFGSEGNGLSKEVLAACRDVVAIPMSAAVDSLNVGSAAAAFLYEVKRQRTRH